ncbi:hypothetical protein [Tropicimonas marinistellae]|uniref:hypothetical protein n=1 Tax=Tropicimonas marinistellae TaxID=1739787 RepID=UPI000834EFFC|nr:hypothetical protein [Tropicimonas marinistellae]
MSSPDRQSPPQRQISLLVALIVAIATPATLALSYYRITGDPTFQPLALTVERLIVGGVDVNHKAVRAIVVGNDTARGLKQAERFGKRIHAAFYGKGVDALVGYRTNDSSDYPTVTFVVDGSTFGPYGEASAAQGIRTAVEALHLSRNNSEAGREHRW